MEIVSVQAAQVGQRIDNFLITRMKGVPKTRLYRALRGGEVRVNGARKKASYLLCCGDQVRLPPLRRSVPTELCVDETLLDKIPVLLEDEHLLVVDKPADLAVHAGSGLRYGMIEALRALRPHTPYLELAHRLDRATSGCLLIAKSRTALLGLHAQFKQSTTDDDKKHTLKKCYVALLKGEWRGGSKEISIPLQKPIRTRRVATQRRDGNASSHPVSTPQRPQKARAALSVFSPCARLMIGANSEIGDAEIFATLMEIELRTGRMHQARAHAASIGQPIAGDYRYGDAEFNRATKKIGLMRLFLHAERLRFRHPIHGGMLEVHAELPSELVSVVKRCHQFTERA